MINEKLKLFREEAEQGGAKDKITEYLLGHLAGVPDMTADELSAACDVSKTTLLNYIRELGYDGITSFKQACREEADEDEEVYSIDGSLFNGLLSLAENIERMTAKKVENIEFCSARLGQDQLRRVANDVIRSKRVYIFAQGGTRPLAHLLSTQLKNYGKEVVITDANLEQNYNPGKDDLFIFLSIIGQSFKVHPELMDKIERYITNKWLITCNQDIDFQGHRWVIPVKEREFSEFVIRHALDLLFAFIETID